MFVRHERWVLGSGSLIGFLLLWESSSRIGWVDPQLASSPSAIMRAMVAVAGSGELWENARVTLLEFGVGFGLAVVLGLSIGLAGGWSGAIGRVVDPFLMTFSATPRSALIPILIVWFGLGFGSKVVLVLLSGVIPIALNTVVGIRACDGRLIQVARSFGASRRSQAVHVLLPAALPQIFAGLRLGLNLALIGVIISEMYVSIAGIGRMIVLYGGVLRVDELLCYILVVSLFGCTLVALLTLAERILVPWR